jgi:hypothetical protein
MMDYKKAAKKASAAQVSMTANEAARLKALVERVGRNPRLDRVYWDKELRKEMAKARPEQRDAFLNNVERWVTRQEEILRKEGGPGSQ